jgi:hypothetical protein
MSLALTLTHRFSYHLGGQEHVDGLALGREDRRRYFVPGFLPCGECGRCRRALVGACVSPRHPLSSDPAPDLALQLPTRFVIPVDEPDEVARLDPQVLSRAGLVAFALTAASTANLIPGDVALWLGHGPLTDVGVWVSRSSGAHGATIGDPSVSTGTPAELDSGHGNRKRVVFLVGPTSDDWTRAIALAEPGATLLAVGSHDQSLPSDLRLPIEARLLQVAAFHPDFLPEAFAALRRREDAPFGKTETADVRITELPARDGA